MADSAGDRLIFHADCNNFFASCEALERPELKNVPLSAGDLLYAGKSAVLTLSSHSIRTIGDVAQTEPRLLKQWLGKAGEQLWRSANGLDQEPVRLFDDRPDPKSVSRGVTYARDLASLEEARQALLPLADEVSAHLRKYQKRGQVIQLSIKSPDLRVIQRQTRLPHPSNLQRELAEGAVALLKANWPLSPFSPIRALTLGVSDLSNEADINEQISLFDTAEMFDQRRRQEKLAHTLDALRDKLGSDVIALGYAAKNPKNKQEPSDEP